MRPLAAAATPVSVARFVGAFWGFATRSALNHRVLPDGCIDFVFDLVSGEARVVGPMQSAGVIPLSAGARLFGVRFLPGAASVFLDAQASELVDVDAQLGDLTRAAAFGLAERVLKARDDRERSAEVTRFLGEQSARRRPLDARVEAAVGLLARAGSSVSEVARSVGVGERQLERLFRERVGLRPKHYARIARLERALSLSDATSRAQSLAPASQVELALRAGYADEPHLLRDFRDLVGLTPAALRAERDVGFVQAAVASAR